MKLNLGCGTNIKEGWVNIDSVESCKPDLMHDISQPLPYASSTIEEILAEDILEHFDKYYRYIIFEDWVRVLKINGTITVQVPDAKKILWKYFKLGFDNCIDMIYGENLWQSRYYLGHFGNHKWGYSEKSLTEFVKGFGIEPVSVERIGFNLRLTGKKVKEINPEDLNSLKIYSHANNCGNGEAYVSLCYVKEKIEAFKSKLIS